MEPAICIDTDSLASELFQCRWFVNGLEQWEQSYILVSQETYLGVFDLPEMPILRYASKRAAV